MYYPNTVVNGLVDRFIQLDNVFFFQHQNITTIRVSLTDVNDNKPEFSASSYAASILLEDAEEGKELLTLSATDRDIGNNSLISYRSVRM